MYKNTHRQFVVLGLIILTFTSCSPTVNTKDEKEVMAYLKNHTFQNVEPSQNISRFIQFNEKFVRITVFSGGDKLHSTTLSYKIGGLSSNNREIVVEELQQDWVLTTTGFIDIHDQGKIIAYSPLEGMENELGNSANESTDAPVAIEDSEKQISSEGNFNLSQDYFFTIKSDGENAQNYNYILFIGRKSDSLVCTKIKSNFDYNSPLGNEINWEGRSYLTGFNEKKEIIDGDEGDLVVSDFNFDGNTDFGLKSDLTHSGVKYDYYLQTNDCNWVLDTFLTNNFYGFPILDPKTKTVVVSSVVGVGMIHDMKYKFRRINNWEMTIDTLYEYNE